MKTYEVAVAVRAELAEAFEAYMRTKHLPEILATGCFATIAFERLSPTRFRTRYAALTARHLESYLEAHAPGFRADFMAHFPEGCVPTREVWDTLQTWEGPA